MHDELLGIIRGILDEGSLWIGGDVQDGGDDIDRQIGRAVEGQYMHSTTITAVSLTDNGGPVPTYFAVSGEDYTCGADLACITRIEEELDGWMVVIGYANHRWRFRKPLR